MTDLTSLTLTEMKELMAEWGEKAFRAQQVYQWIHVKHVHSAEEMSNLPAKLREHLAEETVLTWPEIRTRQISAVDGTRKYLFRFRDGAFVESVWMSYHHGNTVCVSSQVGCRMGCSFCASTLLGLDRNLTAGEILTQIYAISEDTGERVSNVVIMGTGEPLDNYDNVIRFIRILTDENGLHISERNVTLSTCGLVPQIRKLAGEGLMINLALSLHAPNDRLRAQIMPVAKSFSLADILNAMRGYYDSNHRRLSFEYALIAGVNDGDRQISELSALLKGLNCLVNLIPVNPVTETGYRETKAADVQAFKKKLENHGIHVTIRREMGRDIDGACGQLRKRSMELE